LRCLIPAETVLFHILILRKHSDFVFQAPLGDSPNPKKSEFPSVVLECAGHIETHRATR
jgi:hypothetical protein